RRFTHLSLCLFVCSLFIIHLPPTYIYTLSLHDALPILNWKKAIHTCVWKWLAVFFVMFSPFMMTIATAAIPVYRSQYSLPFCCRSEEHTSELQSRFDLVCRLLLEKKNNNMQNCN